jgi:hypothetical protein
MTLGQQERAPDEGDLETTHLFIKINPLCDIRFLRTTERFQLVLQLRDKKLQCSEPGARNGWFDLKIVARSR